VAAPARGTAATARAAAARVSPWLARLEALVLRVVLARRRDVLPRALRSPRLLRRALDVGVRPGAGKRHVAEPGPAPCLTGRRSAWTTGPSCATTATAAPTASSPASR